MDILKLNPVFKDYLWGGTRLAEEYGKEMSGSILAETWELSCHPDGPSYIADGPYTGLTLAQYVETQGKKVLGTHCEKFEDFPILIKFIDPQDNVPIHVHPDNHYRLPRCSLGAGAPRRRTGCRATRFVRQDRDVVCCGCRKGRVSILRIPAGNQQGGVCRADSEGYAFRGSERRFGTEGRYPLY